MAATRRAGRGPNHTAHTENTKPQEATVTTRKPRPTPLATTADDLALDPETVKDLEPGVKSAAVRGGGRATGGACRIGEGV